MFNIFAQGILGSCEDLNLPNCDAARNGGGNGVEQLLSIVFLVAGGVATLYIIIGAIKFASSNGDPNNLKAARDTILYAVIGLIVSLSAFGIVRFVVGST
ncbi:TPA: hypothetical protein EYO12_03865 [Candidatus Saccharibacteria bacterium]|nr:hypothetical protein [Candidatus Saccharibacteria bacterium]HIO87824.1 hypothetical protein [Candidatus Saccharibacteria bacterium]